jgi:hypothetical protein
MVALGTALVEEDTAAVGIGKKADTVETEGTAVLAGIAAVDTAVEDTVPLHTTVPEHN